MWKLVVIFFLIAFEAVAAPQRVVLGKRSYIIDLPANSNGSIIVALHNASGNPEEFSSKTRLSGPAMAQGYAVIYPLGFGLSWNGFYCCGPAQVKRSADIQFLDLVIADATARFKLDAGRVYLTGMGNGAVMAETYAARRASKVKAVAGVAGTMDLRRTSASRVPLLHIHGMDANVVPFGTTGPEFGTEHESDPFTPVPVLIKAFVGAHAQLTKTTRTIDSRNDGTSVIEENYNDSDGVTQVRLLAIVGGGHVWPGKERKGSGNTQEISATKEVLRFFAEHP